MAETLHFSPADAAKLEPHLPSPSSLEPRRLPWVTLTFATSLDSSLSLAPGTRTRLSGPSSKAMTHYLRSRHDAILVGVGTVVADDPGLNCRIGGVGLSGQPRPVVLDPRGRWALSARSKVLELAAAGQGLAPHVITTTGCEDPTRKEWLEQRGGKYIAMSPGGSGGRFEWRDVLAALSLLGLRSVMVEGGGQVINSMLAPTNQDLVDSVIVTIAPTWLGQGGVVVSPERVHDEDGTPVSAARLSSVSWLPFGEDVVLCGKLTQGS